MNWFAMASLFGLDDTARAIRRLTGSGETTIRNVVTVRGGHCSFGKSYCAHLKNNKGFDGIDFVWGVERQEDVDSRPALTGDTIQVIVSTSSADWPVRGRRISHYAATVEGGRPTTYGRHGYSLPDYWYVTLKPDLAFAGPNARFDVKLGTLTMPFKVGASVWVTVDLIEEKVPPHIERYLENYTYCT